VKRSLVIVAAVILGVGIFAAGAVTLLWLSSDSNVTVWVSNDSGAPIHNVVVIVSGVTSIGPQEMAPAAIQDTTATLRARLPIRVAFDADGRHYDVPAQLRFIPLGCPVVSISIGPKMQVSIKTKVVSC